jgi:tetratricopeptide (TPR) repeat protein
MPKKPAPMVDRRATQALELFEKALRALGKKDYGRAGELLDDLLKSFPEQRDILERARAYRAVAERGAGKKAAFRPKSFEELLNYGVFLHNKGEFEEALKFFSQAAEIHPRNENVLYCLAAAAARAGETPAAVKALRSAIVVNPANRAQARSDSDFDPIREDEEFAALVTPQAS